MSMTDGPDMNNFDRRQDSLDREREAAGSSFETTTGGQPVGKTVQISQPLAACGCFGCSSLVFLAGCGVLLVLVWGFLLPDWRANNRYIPNSCLVLDKKLDSQMFDVARPGPRGAKPKVGKEESYRPAIKIRYEINGRKYEPWVYDATKTYSGDRAAQQAIVDSFQVGSTCPCWYDPDRPDQAILVRGHTWGAYVALIFPIGLLTVGGVGTLFAWKLSSIQSGQAASGGIPPQAPAVPRFIRTLQRLASPRKTFDPAQFGDPLAMKTEWSPLKSGGGNFRTHKLVEVDPDRLAFRATMTGIVFALVFLLPGITVFMLVFRDVVSGLSAGKFHFKLFIALLAALSFSIVGGYLLCSWTTPVVFDRRIGFFWKGWKAPEEGYDGSSVGNATDFREIHALQLISSFGGEYYSYELNLVIISGERLNVVAYGSGSRNRLRKDAAIVAEFLGKPVWDALD